MKKRLTVLVVALVIVSLWAGPALEAKKSKVKINLKGFGKFVEQQLKLWEVPGAAVAIVKDGEVVFAQGFGYRNVDKKLNATADTLFAIGSCSKAFTAAVLGILVDEGKLEWDKPVRGYIPEFKLKDPFASEQMTAVDLMCHRSGLPRHDGVWYGASASREALILRLPYLEPTRPFRTTFQYNNLMFLTAGYMAGKQAGVTWEELVKTKIFEPLGMKTSNFSVNCSQEAEDFSLPYSKRDKKLKAIPFRNIDAMGPAGSINSSVREMAQWILLNLNKGKMGDKQIISEVNLTKCHLPQMAVSRPLSKHKEHSYGSYGLGWGQGTYRGHPVVSHGGGIDGFVSSVSFLPNDNAGVVVLTNSDRGGGVLCAVVRYNAYDRILKMKQVPWSKRIKDERAKADKEREKNEVKEKDKKDKDRKLNTQPSHGLDAYAGEFENPGYGIMAVEESGGTLKVTYNGYAMMGEHYHYDVFSFNHKAFDMVFKFSFHSNVKGDIDRVSAPLQEGVEDIVFTRMAAGKLKDPAFLKKLTGEYELHGEAAVITLNSANELIANVPGQQPYTLVPYKGTEFTLKQLKGFTIKFILDKAGNVTGLESHQPNGVFKAKKKK